MAYNPVAGIVPQYQDEKRKPFRDGWLKFYIANTTTPLSMATNETGADLLVKCKLSDAGFPITNPLDNDSVFIPHVNQAYRQVIYTSEADADANNTAAALVNVAEVLPLATLSQGITADVEFSGVAGTSSFTIEYTVGFVRVLYNGVQLPSTDYTATDGSSITLAQPVLDDGDVITFLQVTYTDTEFTNIAGQTGVTLTYTVGKVRLMYNGVYLPASDYTATDGSTISFGFTVENNGDVITVVRLV